MFKIKIQLTVVIFIICNLNLYSQEKQIKEKTEIYSNSMQGVIAIVTYEYNVEGQLFKKTKYTQAKDVVSSNTYEYTPQGYLLQETEFNRLDSLVEKVMYSYDSLGTITTDTRFTAKDNVTTERNLSVSYDNKNRISTLFELDSSGNVEGKYAYTYSRKGKKRECLYTQNNLENKQWKYKYEGDLLVNELLYVINEGEKKKNTLYYYKYNSQGNLLLKTRYMLGEYLPESIIQHFHYYYNDQDELIGVICMQGGKKMSKIEFAYTYY